MTPMTEVSRDDAAAGAVQVRSAKNQRPRVVITGVGMITPIGSGREQFWPRLLAGTCAAAEIEAFDTSGYRVHRGCEVRDFDFERLVGQPPPPGMGRAAQLAITATQFALRDGELSVRQVDPHRIGVCIGTTCGEIQVLEAHNRAAASAGAPPDDGWIERHAACAIPASVGHWFSLAGPNVIIPTACAAGNFSVGYAADIIRRGRADVMLAGGTDPFSRVAFTGFARLGSVAPELCQPFDRDRRGILVGEGAGIIVLERLEHAQARHARIYAELAGYGLSSDAYHMTTPDPTGDGLARAMRAALVDARLAPEHVEYICAHGTGTPINDVVETRAAKTVLGRHAARVPMSSIKSMLGHTMGAASAIETIACALTLWDGTVPPTANYQTPDPECDLDYVPNRARRDRPRVVLNNALAFGGVNSCVALAQLGEAP